MFAEIKDLDLPAAGRNRRRHRKFGRAGRRGLKLLKIYKINRRKITKNADGADLTYAGGTKSAVTFKPNSREFSGIGLIGGPISIAGCRHWSWLSRPHISSVLPAAGPTPLPQTVREDFAVIPRSVSDLSG